MAKNMRIRDVRVALNANSPKFIDGSSNWVTGACSDPKWGSEETCIIAGTCSDANLIGKSECLCGAGGLWDGAACSSGTATGETFTVNTWTETAATPTFWDVSKTGLPQCTGNVHGIVYLSEADCLAAGTCSDTQYTTAGTCTGASETWTSAEYKWIDPQYPKKVKHVQNVPAAETDACVIGDMAVDAGFLFVCVQDNTWKKVALSAI